MLPLHFALVLTRVHTAEVRIFLPEKRCVIWRFDLFPYISKIKDPNRKWRPGTTLKTGRYRKARRVGKKEKFMEAQKVDMFLMTNAKYFESHQISYIRERLLQLDDSKFINIQAANLKDPTISLIVSIIGGNLGIDRFIIGDVGLGVAKLLTCGGFGIWMIVDWFLIMGRTREVNIEKMQQVMAV